MRTLLFAVASLAALGRPVTADEPTRLAGFTAIAEVVVTSAHSDLSEARLRRLVETRLKKVGLLLEDSAPAGGRLNLSVSGHHDSSGAGSLPTRRTMLL